MWYSLNSIVFCLLTVQTNYPFSSNRWAGLFFFFFYRTQWNSTLKSAAAVSMRWAPINRPGKRRPMKPERLRHKWKVKVHEQMPKGETGTNDDKMIWSYAEQKQLSTDPHSAEEQWGPADAAEGACELWRAPRRPVITLKWTVTANMILTWLCSDENLRHFWKKDFAIIQLICLKWE